MVRNCVSAAIADSRAERAAIRCRAGGQRSAELQPQRRGRAKARVRGYLVDGLVGRFQQPLRPVLPAPLLARLIVNVGIVLVFAAFYLRFLKRP
jgi:hypothetical protein